MSSSSVHLPALSLSQTQSSMALGNNASPFEDYMQQDMLRRSWNRAWGDGTPRAALAEALDWEESLDAPRGQVRGENECIRVAARFRPLSENEKIAAAAAEDSGSCVRFGNNGQTCVLTADRTHGVNEFEFCYDHMFQPEATQEEVYRTVAHPIVEGVINGFNGAILAYGQTGSGKTHTMLGPNGAQAFADETSQVNPAELGITPRALQALLDYAAASDGLVRLRASYVEIYNEHVIDLLAPVTGGSLVREHALDSAALRERAEHLYLPTVTETPIETVAEALDVMRTGNRNRHQAETKMNRHSSRSHAVFIVTATNSIDQARHKFGQLYLVDLAGSERVSKTGVAGQQLVEAKNIGISLLALGQVIYALAHKRSHVPYRDSKLTQLLRNCLGGNARTAVMIAASPHISNANETLSALRFGARASLVQNLTRENVAEDPRELRKLLLRAREDLNALRGHCRRLQAEVAAFAAADFLPQAAPSPVPRLCDSPEQPMTSLPSLQSGGGQSSAQVPWKHVGEESTLDALEVQTSTDGRLQYMLSRKMLVWGLLPSLVCPIGRTVMRDPVVASDGWTYDRSAIERLFLRSGRNLPISPVSGVRFPTRQVMSNMVIKQLVKQHMPDLGPPQARVSALAMVHVWHVQLILSFLDARSLGRCEKAWPCFLAATETSKMWHALLKLDYQIPEDDIPAAGRAAKMLYVKVRKDRKKEAIGLPAVEPRKQGLTLFRAPATW
eukprot:CAMPEP_0178419114 /NCGR_PEP_ID=MMETSP0689_2-20121128/25441_1 /TAXON_ID=160604 /ORGANISM="Amphidinium massartii, Strain CS-259" /LENGTH=730 /DNA_ID=CAMNT_0020040537 /DNA_START=21 /DNA_END=2211 /DNA_ORIENTATION=-